MSLRPKTLPFVTSLLLLALAPASSPAAKLNLERVTPVPAEEQIPIMDFFRAPLISQPSLNPSGTHIAALVTGNEDKHRLWTFELNTKKADMLGGVGDKDIYSFAWLTDQRLVYFLSTEKLYGLGMLGVEAGNLSKSYAVIQYYGARLIAIPQANRTRPLVWLSYDSLDTERDGGVATVNTDVKSGSFINLARAGNDLEMWAAINAAKDNNERHIVTRHPQPKEGIAVGYMADKAGKLEYAFTGANGYFTLHHLDGNKWKKSPVDLEKLDVMTSGNKPGELLVLAPSEEGKPQALRFMDGVTGKMGDLLFQDNAYDFDGWIYRDAASRDIVGINYNRNGPKTVWFDESYRSLQKVLDGFFPGVVTRILDGDERGKIFLIATFSDRQPTVYSWVNLETKSVGLIEKSRPWIDPKRMQPVNILKFKTKDGRSLDAYLTLPAGASKEHPVPLVVLPHGGPWVRDTWGFDGEAQFLASRGYGVLQPNYRGSTGYDWMFPADDRYDFLKMHEDVTSATKAALATKLVDPGRVAIMGGSFGGYLALSGAVHEPTLYRCAVSIAGVFDWRQLLKQEKYYQYQSASYGRLVRKLGDPKHDTEKYDSISPLLHVDQIRVPVFVAHGKEDQVVDIEQSERLVSELKKHNVAHERLFIGGEGHGMGHLENQLELYTRIEAFLAKNLAPLATTAATTGQP